MTKAYAVQDASLNSCSGNYHKLSNHRIVISYISKLLSFLSNHLIIVIVHALKNLRGRTDIAWSKFMLPTSDIDQSSVEKQTTDSTGRARFITVILTYT